MNEKLWLPQPAKKQRGTVQPARLVAEKDVLTRTSEGVPNLAKRLVACLVTDAEFRELLRCMERKLDGPGRPNKLESGPHTLESPTIWRI